MEENIIYWIWLQTCLGAGNPRILPALDVFGNAYEMYCASDEELEASGIFKAKELEKLRRKDVSYAESAAEKCDAFGIHMLHAGGKGYPERLMKTDSPPVMLYAKGELPPENAWHVAVVGTRYPMDSSYTLTGCFTRGLVGEGAVIVSGGAVGIDHSAHLAAVNAGGMTICVLGCGIDRMSETCSPDLCEALKGSGTVVSEYPPGYPSMKHTFPMRDRIISGLSDCCLVMQSGTGSGSLITAKYSIMQKRKLFVVPGAPGSDRTIGNNILIRAGFEAVLDHRDITQWLRYDMPYIKGDPNPPADKELLNAIAVKSDKLLYGSGQSGSKNAPAGYRLSLKLKENENTYKRRDSNAQQLFLETDESDHSVSIVENSLLTPEKETEIAAGVTSADIDNDPGKEETVTEGKENEADMPEAYPQNAEEERPAIRTHYDVLEEDAAAMDDMKESGNDDAKAVWAATKLSIPESLDLASDGFRRIVADEYRYRRIGIQSPYSSISKDFFDHIFPLVQDEEKYETALQDAEEHTEHRSERKSTEKNKKKTQKAVINNALSFAETEKMTENLPERLTERTQTVYDTFSDTSLSADEIVIATGLPVPAVFTAITELLSKGYIKAAPGSKYMKT